MSDLADSDQPTPASGALAGSRPIFPGRPGDQLVSGLLLGDFGEKRLIFNRIDKPGQVHVFKAECQAGERLRAQMLVPVLPRGDTAIPAFAIVGQSLPYSADAHHLPVDLPQGYSAIVASSPSQLTQPEEDLLTRARYYPGPVIDTRTLVGGTCYLVIWSPKNHMGNYLFRTGYRWPLRITYWSRIPLFWWQIRGWFGLDRSGVVGALAGLALAGLMAVWLLQKE